MRVSHAFTCVYLRQELLVARDADACADILEDILQLHQSVSQ